MLQFDRPVLILCQSYGTFSSLKELHIERPHIISVRELHAKLFNEYLSPQLPPKREGSWVRITTAMTLGIVWTGFNQSVHQSSKNAAAVQFLCTWRHKQPQFLWCGIVACPVPPNNPKCLCVADSDPRFPLVLVMPNSE